MLQYDASTSTKTAKSVVFGYFDFEACSVSFLLRTLWDYERLALYVYNLHEPVGPKQEIR
jgi:hypothetical protein